MTGCTRRLSRSARDIEAHARTLNVRITDTLREKAIQEVRADLFVATQVKLRELPGLFVNDIRLPSVAPPGTPGNRGT